MLRRPFGSVGRIENPVQFRNGTATVNGEKLCKAKAGHSRISEKTAAVSVIRKSGDLLDLQYDAALRVMEPVSLFARKTAAPVIPPDDRRVIFRCPDFSRPARTDAGKPAISPNRG